ncbi:hypothetical protein ACKFRT_04425 [Corynebacterium sp. YSMAA1_1_F7]|uniref:hypothetical protein n=1 Tax=Corynebacterium sp. YSMAA1_1_F7 TaxID=3383590 RepID=UPI0038CF99C9
MTNYQRALGLADHIADVDETPRELVKQLHQNGLLMPDLPDPTITGYAYSFWTTNRTIAIDRDAEKDGAVVHYHERGLIYLDTGREEDPALHYDEARRVALALLAAVEEAETMKENTL